MAVTIENPRGSVRRGTGPDGQPWEAAMQGDYGYVRGTRGADGEQLDVFMGGSPGSEKVYVIDQQDPATGKFDEHKIVANAASPEEARAIYAGSFSDDSGPARIRSVREMTLAEFNAWRRDGNMKRPAKHRKDPTPEVPGQQVEAQGQEPAPWDMDWGAGVEAPLSSTAAKTEQHLPWEMQWGEPSAEPVVDTSPSSGGEQQPYTAGKRDLGDTGNDPYKGLGNPYSPFTQGATLGASDEIVSALMTPVEMAVNAVTGDGPINPTEVYAQQKARMERDKALYEEQNPVMSTVAEVGGGLMTGAAGAKFMSAAPSLIGKAVRSGVVGASLGGTQGFMGTDGSIEDRAEGAAQGAAFGAALGSTLPPVFAMSRALIRGATTPIRSLANADTFAAQKVAEALQRDKLSPDRIATRLSNNLSRKGDLAVADVAGDNTSNLLRAASNVPSEARRGMTQQLEYRQDKQLPRLQDDIANALGDHAQFYQTTEQLVATRKAAAKPMFDTAFKTPTPYSFELEKVLNRPLTKQLVQRARIAAKNRGEDFKGLLFTQGPTGRLKARRVIDTEGLHRVKMTIDDMINGMKRGEDNGLKNVGMRDLTILKKDLLAAMDNPQYRAALKQYAGDSAMVNALDEGFEEGMKMAPEKIQATLTGLSPSEARLWRMGFSRAIADTLRDTGRQGANRAELLASPKLLSRVQAAIPDQDARRELLQSIQLERRMARTRNAVQGNSTTARQLAEGQEAGVEAQDAQDIMRAAGQLSRGDFLGAAVAYLGRAKNYATGLRPEVADEIIRLLTAKTPKSIRAAKALIDQQAIKLNRRKGAIELLDGLRAVSSGLLGGHVGNHATSQQPNP